MKKLYVGLNVFIPIEEKGIEKSYKTKIIFLSDKHIMLEHPKYRLGANIVIDIFQYDLSKIKIIV